MKLVPGNNFKIKDDEIEFVRRYIYLKHSISIGKDCQTS